VWTIIGQERAVAVLSQAITQGRVSHAYLFSGPSQVGKATAALQLAQALNCRGEDPPCGRCRQCHLIAEGKHPDVEVIGIGGLCDESDHKDHSADGSKEIRICQVRRLKRLVSRAPFQGRYRVVIVDPADALNVESSNALLKTLEEPPASLVLILVTSREEALLPTVRSRCRRVPFAALPAAEIAKALEEVWEVPAADADALARLSGGRLGWAVTAWEDETVLPAREAVLEDVYRLAAAGRDERFDYASQLASRFYRDREGVLAVLDLWQEWWRDVLLVAAGCTDIAVNSGSLDRLSLLVRKYDIGQVKSFLEAIARTRERLLENVSPLLALEVLMLDLPATALRKENTLPRAGDDATSAARPAAV
jgi:DNA polymerase-3 subunit delta'